MAIKNRTVEILGSEARVSCVTIYPQPDGSAVIGVVGLTKNSDGGLAELKEAQIVYEPSKLPNDAMRLLLELSIGALRKVNGLEDAPLPIEPKLDAEAQPAEAEAQPKA